MYLHEQNVFGVGQPALPTSAPQQAVAGFNAMDDQVYSVYHNSLQDIWNQISYAANQLAQSPYWLAKTLPQLSQLNNQAVRVQSFLARRAAYLRSLHGLIIEPSMPA